jgi:hypothetical protein
MEEEGEYEYASYHQGAKPESGEGHVEPAVLYQPLGGGEEDGSKQGSGSVENWFCTMIGRGSYNNGKKEAHGAYSTEDIGKVIRVSALGVPVEVLETRAER